MSANGSAADTRINLTALFDATFRPGRHFHPASRVPVQQGRNFNPANPGPASQGEAFGYGRDVHITTLPRLASYAEVQLCAEKILSGETARAAAEAPPTFDSGATMDSGLRFDGTHVPMALPSAAEVGEKLDEFKALRAQSDSAQTNTNREQEEAMALYPEAQALAVDICETVEFFHRKDPVASSRREKCRRWGVVYVNDDGTAEPPTPTPPGN